MMHPRYAPRETPKDFLFFSHFGPECATVADVEAKIRQRFPTITDADMWVQPYNGLTPSSSRWTAFVRNTRGGELKQFLAELYVLQLLTEELCL